MPRSQTNEARQTTRINASQPNETTQRGTRVHPRSRTPNKAQCCSLGMGFLRCTQSKNLVGHLHYRKDMDILPSFMYKLSTRGIVNHTEARLQSRSSIAAIAFPATEWSRLSRFLLSRSRSQRLTTTKCKPSFSSFPQPAFCNANNRQLSEHFPNKAALPGHHSPCYHGHMYHVIAVLHTTRNKVEQRQALVVDPGRMAEAMSPKAR